VGFTGSIHARASGKLLLAFAPAEVREDLLDGYDFTRHTANTITSRQDLEAELQGILSAGYALDQQEFRGHRALLAGLRPPR
jgi:IclR family transcriptional regulator, acetate operon repressor